MYSNKLAYVMYSQLLLFCFIFIIMLMFSDTNNPYFNMGPSDDLYVLAINVNTPSKYCGVMIMTLIINIIKTINTEVATPILNFNIYNPDKKIITEYTKNELFVYGNIIYFISSLIKNVLLILLSISQLDIALWSVMTSELTSIIITRSLLNNKEFSINDDETNFINV